MYLTMVEFRFGKQIIKNISFVVHPGKTLALVGWHSINLIMKNTIHHIIGGSVWQRKIHDSSSFISLLQCHIW